MGSGPEHLDPGVGDVGSGSFEKGHEEAPPARGAFLRFFTSDVDASAALSGWARDDRSRAFGLPSGGGTLGPALRRRCVRVGLFRVPCADAPMEYDRRTCPYGLGRS